MTVSPFRSRTSYQIERDEARTELEHSRREVEALRDELKREQETAAELRRQLLAAVLTVPEAFEAQ